MQHCLAGDHDFDIGAASEQIGQQWGGVDHSLERIEHEQQPSCADGCSEISIERLLPGLANPERLGDRRRNQTGIADSGERDDANAVGKIARNARCHRKGETCFADSARSR